MSNEYAPTTIRQYRSRRRLLQRYIASTIPTPDELIKAQLELTELELKLGTENLGPVKLGRPRVKLTLRGEDLRKYEEAQKEGRVDRPTEWTPEATKARALTRLGITSEESERRLNEMQKTAAEAKANLSEGDRLRAEKEKQEREARIREARKKEAEELRARLATLEEPEDVPYLAPEHIDELERQNKEEDERRRKAEEEYHEKRNMENIKETDKGSTPTTA